MPSQFAQELIGGTTLLEASHPSGRQLPAMAPIRYRRNRNHRSTVMLNEKSLHFLPGPDPHRFPQATRKSDLAFAGRIHR